MNRMYDPILCPVMEGIDQKDYVIATYLVGAQREEDIIVKAGSIAVEQTTGSWTDVPEETDEVRRKHAAKVVGIYSIPDYELAATIPANVELRYFVLRLAFPWVNFYDNIPLMFSSVIGNISSLPYLKLLDLEFPEPYVRQFKGPKFGLEGIRRILGVQDRPLVNNMIKPCTGFPPEVGARLFYEAAAGGIDIIKDDELIASPSFSPLEERVRQYMEAAKRADEEKGEKTLYTVNITSETRDLVDSAKRAIDAGANAIMVDAFCVGLSALRELAENPDVTVPILAHIAFMGAWSSSPYCGVSWPVLTKLVRLAGADTCLVYAPYGKFDNLKEKYIRSVQVCTSEFYHLKPVLPFVGGGVTPGMVPVIMNDCGHQVLIGAGAAVHAHPMGPRAGARALRQAIKATMEGIPLEEAAKTYPELKSALEVWGIVTSVESQKRLYTI